MRANIEDSYAELTPAAARLLRLLALHTGDGVDPAAAAALADVPEPQARELLDALTAHGLVTETGGRYRVPGHVRDFAHDRARREDTATDREAALRRLLDHHLAATAADGEEPGAEGLALLERERWAEAADVLEEALRRAEHGDDHHAALLARLDLARALTRAGDTRRAIDLLGNLPAQLAALPVPDQTARADALAELGEAHLREHRPVAATNFFGQALEIFRKENDTDRQAAMFARIAEAAHQRGDHTAEKAAVFVQGGDPLEPPLRRMRSSRRR